MRTAGRLVVIAALLCAQAAWSQNGNKILRVTFQAAETGFDPVRIHDYYSGHVLEAVYDTLLTYDYLARPAKLVASAAGMPEISAESRTYTFRIKKGIYFTDDPAFKGKKRELTA
ncbi:MAG: heme-binding protein, partial [Betaproteobacteria bacterium]|nr:heme-binding protein [Betaproteobacteria bacterium]